MHRFFVSPESIQGNYVEIPEPVAHQISRVLRLNPQDNVVLMDNSGQEYAVRMLNIGKTCVTGEITNKMLGLGNPSISITLFQGILKGDGFENVLQKGTELGISNFIPVLCKRSIPRPRTMDSWGNNKYERWKNILKESSEQCGRSIMPTILHPVTFVQALQLSSGVRMMAWEEESQAGFREVLLNSAEAIRMKGLSFFVGPEGGFCHQEVHDALASGISTFSLGTRIMRGETAGLAVAASVMYQLGELGP